MPVDSQALADAVLKHAQTTASYKTPMSYVVSKLAENMPETDKNAPAVTFPAHPGIIQALRAVLAPIAPFQQIDTIRALRKLAYSPGFSTASFVTALDYLGEANAAGPTAPSEWGLGDDATECEKCGWDLSGGESHYHCPDCGGECEAVK